MARPDLADLPAHLPPPDVRVLGGPARGPERNLYYQRRRLADGELFFLASHSAGVETYRVWLAAEGACELLDPETGQRFRLPAGEPADGGQVLTLRFEPYQAYGLVVTAQANAALPPWPAPPVPAAGLEAWWTIQFLSNQANPHLAPYDHEFDLSERPLGTTAVLRPWRDLGYFTFSGSARYRCTFHSASVPAGERVWLDLGRVEQIAEVALNGQQLGARAWAPYRFDLTEVLAGGRNILEVVVSNTLASSLAAGHGGAPSAMPFVAPQFLDSGLLGPVQFLISPAADGA
jgi:hypothetical protein